MSPASGCYRTFTFLLRAFHPPQSAVRHSGVVKPIRKDAVTPAAAGSNRRPGGKGAHTNRLSIVATRSPMERNGFAVPAGTASGSAPCACRDNCAATNDCDSMQPWRIYVGPSLVEGRLGIGSPSSASAGLRRDKSGGPTGHQTDIHRIADAPRQKGGDGK